MFKLDTLLILLFSLFIFFGKNELQKEKESNPESLGIFSKELELRFEPPGCWRYLPNNKKYSRKTPFYVSTDKTKKG
jgi:hypothetical protein